MPKDFMCDRITENSPIRFLDLDASDYLFNKYRPSIPYVLQTIFGDGEIRASKSGKKLNSNKKTSWDRFQRLLNVYEKYMLMGGEYGNLNHRDKNFISQNYLPTMKLDVGGRKIELPIEDEIKIIGEQSKDYMKVMVMEHKRTLREKLERCHYPLSRYDYLNPHHRREGIVCRFRDWTNFRGQQTSKLNKYDELDYSKISKRKKRWCKEYEVPNEWNLPAGIREMIRDREKQSHPLEPNIYNTKKEIMELIQKEYELEDKVYNRMYKKYSIKEILAMYWKGLVGIV